MRKLELGMAEEEEEEAGAGRERSFLNVISYFSEVDSSILQLLVALERAFM